MNVISDATDISSPEFPPEISSSQHQEPVDIPGEQGRVNGAAGLPPTNQPYFLGEMFPQLLKFLTEHCQLPQKRSNPRL